MIIPSEQREKNIEWIKIKIVKMEHYKISKLLSDSTVSKFVSKKLIEVNDLIRGSIFSKQEYKV